jgi:hypothetical protein
MWQRLPGWRILAGLARLPAGLRLLELSYRGFLRLRPALQTVARRWERAPLCGAALSKHLERELRSAGLFESNDEAVQREEARRGVRRAAPRALTRCAAAPGAGQAGHAGQGVGAQRQRRQGLHRAAAV